jgi:hypothetical protein
MLTPAHPVTFSPFHMERGAGGYVGPFNVSILVRPERNHLSPPLFLTSFQLDVIINSLLTHIFCLDARCNPTVFF